jgi:hypothetical protein
LIDVRRITDGHIFCPGLGEEIVGAGLDTTLVAGGLVVAGPLLSAVAPVRPGTFTPS